MRTIDGDALLEKFAKLEAIALEYVGKLNERQDPNEHDMWVMWTGILNERTAYKYEIVDAPTVDAVPVIRCKDCKHYYALNEVRGNCSEYNFIEKIPIDYCSWAERKEENGK